MSQILPVRIRQKTLFCPLFFSPFVILFIPSVVKELWFNEFSAVVVSL